MRSRKAQEGHTHGPFSDTADGMAPAFGNTNGYYLRDDGVWAPAGGGLEMTYSRQNLLFDMAVTGTTTDRYISGSLASGGASGGAGSADYVIGTAPEIRRYQASHSLVGLGTQWRSVWGTPIGFVSTATGFKASWYFGDGGTTLNQMYTGMRNTYGAGAADVRILGRFVGLVCTSTLGTMRWWAGATNTTATGGASQDHPYWVSGDAAEQADTGITWACDTIYKVSFECVEGGSSVSATLTDVTNGGSHSHTFSSNVPDANALGSAGDPYGLSPWFQTTTGTSGGASWWSHVVCSRGLEAGL